MGKNCLVTKLKGAVDADLEKYGELLYEVPVAAAGNTIDVQIGLFQDGVISIEGDLELWDYTLTINFGSSYTNPDPAPSTRTVKIKINGAGKYTISSKYAMKLLNSGAGLTLYPTKFGYNMESISYWWKGNRFIVNNFTNKSASNRCLINGEFKELERANLPLTELNLNHSDVICTIEDFVFYKDTLLIVDAVLTNTTGNIELLGNCTHLNSFNLTSVLQPSKLTGSIEGFVARQRAAGRTTGSCSTAFTGASITFNGEIASGSYGNKNLSWDATTITYNGETITA